MDMTYALISKIYSEAQAKYLANIMEYEPHTDSSWDPFAAVWGVVPMNSTNGTTSEAKSADSKSSASRSSGLMGIVCAAAMALVGTLGML